MNSKIPALSSEPIPSSPPSRTRPIGSLWRRFLAYLVDISILGFVGYRAGDALFDMFSHLGPWGRLVGFCVALPYFGILESRIGGGQSIGKRWLKLRVVDARGSTLSFRKTLARCAVFAVPSFLFGFDLALPVTRTPWFASILMFAVVFGIGGSTLYFITFNSNTRQGLHDRAVGSYVANAGDTGPVEARPIGMLDWAIPVSLFVMLALFVGIGNNVLAKRSPAPEMRQDALLIERMAGVQRAHATDRLLHDRSGGGAKKILVIVIRTEKPGNYEAFADEVASTILQNDPHAREYDQLSIRILRGYDLGIASRWQHQEFAHTPDEWRKRFLPSPSTPSHP